MKILKQLLGCALGATKLEMHLPPHHYIHGDGRYEGKHYLVIVDAHSKWPKVIGPMVSTTAQATIAALRSMIARFGRPIKL